MSIKRSNTFKQKSKYSQPTSLIKKSTHVYLLMSNKKDKQVHKRKIKRSVFNTLFIMLDSFSFNFSVKPNAKYGLTHFIAIVTEMSHSRATSEEAVRSFDEKNKMPSAKWFHNVINSMSQEVLDGICEKIMKQTTGIVKDLRSHKGYVVIAIDRHLIPRHDKFNLLNFIKTKAKCGTSKFECYITMQLVNCDINAVLGCLKMRRDDSNADFMRKLLKKLKFHVDLLLVDREFYNVSVISTISELGCKFLMPAVKNVGIKKAIVQHDDGDREPVSKYTIEVMRNPGTNDRTCDQKSKTYPSLYRLTRT